MKIIAVCLGNICRSPLAHGILNHLANEHKLDVYVDSAGTGSYHAGESPCNGSIQVALANGIDIRHFKARQITAHDLEYFDLILAMDTSNYNDLIRMSKDKIQKDKIRLVLNYSFPEQNRSVPDSYFTKNYQEVFDLLYDACQELIKEIPNNKSQLIQDEQKKQDHSLN